MAGVPPIRLRGIRATIPTGHILGRTSTGHGDVELIPIDKNGNIIGSGGAGTGGGGSGGSGGGGGTGGGGTGTGTGTGTSTGNAVFQEFLGFYAAGPFTALQNFPLAMAARPVVFPSTLTVNASIAVCEIAPTASFDCVMTDDYGAYLSLGTHITAQIHFDAGATTGSISYPASTLIPFGKICHVVMPLSPDATLGNIECLFCGDPQ